MQHLLRHIGTYRKCPEYRGNSKSTMPGIDDFHATALKVVDIARSNCCARRVRDGGNLGIKLRDGSTRTPALRGDACVWPCRSAIEGEDAAVELAGKHRFG